MARTLSMVAAVIGAAAGTAVAQSEDPYKLAEPTVSSSKVLKLSSAARCLRDPRVRIRFTPPTGAVFSFTVDVDSLRELELTGIPRAASATLRLSRGTSRVLVRGETLGGQTVRKSRTYRRCPPSTPRVKRKRPTVPLQEGGGED